MRILPFLLAFGLAAAGLAAPGALHAANPPMDDGAIVIVAAPAFGGVVRAGSDLMVTGTVSNTTAQTTETSVATLLLSPPTISRNTLNRWLDPSENVDALGTALGSVPIGALAPGQVRNFTITIPSDTLGMSLGMSSVKLASYPVAVRLTAGSVELGVARTAIVWSPLGAEASVNLAVAMPLITPPSNTGLLTAEELAQYTSFGGVLSGELNAALSHTVAIGIDPMILASIRLLGTSAPTSAVEWLDRLSLAPNETFALSYADSDIALASQAGAKSPLVPITFPIDPALFAPATTESPAPIPTTAAVPTLPTNESLVAWPYTIDSLAWPDDNTVVEADLDNFATAGSTRTVVSSRQLNPAPARSPNVALGEHDAVVSDAVLSDQLRAAANASNDAVWKQAMASIGAELAAAASSSSGSTVLATLGRDGSVSGPRLSATLTAIEGLPWVVSTNLSDVLSVTKVPAKLVGAPEPATRVASLSTLLFSPGGPSERRVSAFSSVLSDPTLLTGPRRLALLGILAQSWHTDQAGWNDALTQHLADNTTILSSVRIPDSSTINLFQEKGNLPIAVSNDLDFPVTVYVTVAPERAILRVPQSRVELTIEANSRAKASIAVESIANGEVRTTVSLTSGTNVQISTPTIVDLNVQAGWETAATVVLAGIVVLLFGAGIWRTVLRRRKLRVEAKLTYAAESRSPEDSPVEPETGAQPVSSGT